MNGLRALPAMTPDPSPSDPKSGRTRSEVSRPFQALLAATRESVRAQTMSEVRGSPQQMFEPKNVEERDRRTQELREADTAHEESAQVSRSNELKGERGPSPGVKPSPTPTFGLPQATRQIHSTDVESVSQLDTEAVPSPTGESPERLETTDASLKSATGNAGSERSTPSELKTVSPPPAVSRGNVIAIGTTSAAGSDAASEGGRTIARSLGEALGGRAIDEAASSRAASMTQTTSPSSKADERNAAARAPQEKPSGEAPATTRNGTVDDAAHLSPFERMVRSIRLNVGERFSSARMDLDPPDLGRMHVEVQMRGDAVELEVRTSSEAAREIVAGRAEELKLALEQHGVQVERFDVVVDDTAAASLRRGDRSDKPMRRRESRSTAERADVRRALSRMGRLDVEA